MSEWNVDCAVVNTRYQSNNDDNSTTIELWSRTKCGHSLLLLVQGKRPFMEITLPGVIEKEEKLPDDIGERLERISKDPDVIEIQGPEIKWTDLGEKYVENVGENRQPELCENAGENVRDYFFAGGKNRPKNVE